MTEANRLTESLKALGYETRSSPLRVEGKMGGRRVSFLRLREKAAFGTTFNETDALNAIQKKYTEIGVRKWAKARGFAVAGFDG